MTKTNTSNAAEQKSCSEGASAAHSRASAATAADLPAQPETEDLPMREEEQQDLYQLNDLGA